MVREQKNNYAALSGEVIQEPIYSHSAGGEDYFTFPLRCLRLSGAEDLLNLVLSRTQLEQLDGRIDAIVLGEAKGKLASTIVDMSEEEPRIVREGPISADDIKRVLHNA